MKQMSLSEKVYYGGQTQVDKKAE